MRRLASILGGAVIVLGLLAIWGATLVEDSEGKTLLERVPVVGEAAHGTLEAVGFIDPRGPILMAAPPSRSESEAEMRAVMRRYVTAFKTGDAAGVCAEFSDDVRKTMVELAAGDPNVDAESCEDLFLLVFAEIRDVEYAVVLTEFRITAADRAEAIASTTAGGRTESGVVRFVREGGRWAIDAQPGT